MRIERLIGIISVLLQQKTVTTPYLAEKFEVSRRTINHDVEMLASAGIPIYTTQGVKGGIFILENENFNGVKLNYERILYCTKQN